MQGRDKLTDSYNHPLVMSLITAETLRYSRRDAELA